MVDNKELRDLLVFISADLTNKDIPHHSMLSKLIVENFQREYMKLQEEIQVNSNSLISNSSLTYLSKNSAGRVSYTSDVWSRNDLSAFMAVTAHYFWWRMLVVILIKGTVSLLFDTFMEVTLARISLTCFFESLRSCRFWIVYVFYIFWTIFLMLIAVDGNDHSWQCIKQ